MSLFTLLPVEVAEIERQACANQMHIFEVAVHRADVQVKFFVFFVRQADHPFTG